MFISQINHANTSRQLIKKKNLSYSVTNTTERESRYPSDWAGVLSCLHHVVQFT